ncbi:hypothetical protein ABIB25_004094 [Nakamurella sp. UYEF19]|uniref:nuclear transport factor 2 family protein n=1 Tax=Nakamurella sp. UYEF19 TaxID=1756392 RepID=UPI003394F358
MKTSTDLPAVVVDYFDLMDRDDNAAVVDLFAPGAQVTDDGQTYRGRAEIAGWLGGPAGEFTTTSTQLSADRSDQQVTVVIRVEGDFPGGRVDLRNVFTLDPAGLIRDLLITV